MESFVINNNGKEGTVKIGEVKSNSYGNIKMVEIIELIVEDVMKVKNALAYIAFGHDEKEKEVKQKFMKLENDGPTLEITDPSFISFLQEA
ncbi:MAG: hypothetical protein ACM3X7_07725 [Solirubrobacterales bacterium]